MLQQDLCHNSIETNTPLIGWGKTNKVMQHNIKLHEWGYVNIFLWSKAGTHRSGVTSWFSLSRCLIHFCFLKSLPRLPISSSYVSCSIPPTPSWLQSSLSLPANLIISIAYCLAVIDLPPAKWSLISQENPVICNSKSVLVPMTQTNQYYTDFSELISDFVYL